METPKKTSLFWDVDTTTLDLAKHKQFIIERILARGDLADFSWVKKTYGDNAVKEGFLHARALDPRSISFWQYYFDIDAQSCTPKLSLPRQSAFWKK